MMDDLDGEGVEDTGKTLVVVAKKVVTLLSDSVVKLAVIEGMALPTLELFLVEPDTKFTIDKLSVIQC